VVSHPDRPQSNNAHLTVLQYYNMHADIIQENNPFEAKPGDDGRMKTPTEALFLFHLIN